MKLDKIISILEGKKLLILGFGKEGFATYLFLRKIFPEVKLTIADRNENLLSSYSELKEDGLLDFKLGNNYLNEIDDFEIIIKAPGVSFSANKIIIDSNKITSQTDLFLSQFASQVIGVTGTKGKSTTCSLLFHVLKERFQDVILVGNIGLPPFNFIDNITENTLIVFELSSHQLEFIKSSPHISILLNIFQEHLDHYNSYNDYQIAKFNIASKQIKDDVFIYSSDNEAINYLMLNNKLNSNLYQFSSESENIVNGIYVNNNKLYRKSPSLIEYFYNSNTKIPLKGKHNLLNISAALIACEILGVESEFFFNSLSYFQGLPHRIQHVGTFDGIIYYNDSIATIPEATIQAVDALEIVDTLIIGGFDRGIDYSLLSDFLMKNNINNVFFMGEAGKRIYNSLIGIENRNFKIVSDIDEAVILAKRFTQKEKICLLSPAASSYDNFKNFEHRGDYFIQLVSK